TLEFASSGYFAKAAPAWNEDLRLDREIGPCRFNKADAWQMILGANIRKPAILELTDFADGATFYGRFICNDQTFTALNDTHASNHASADKLIFHSDAREWCDLKKI